MFSLILIESLDRYMECNRPWIASMESCNHVRVNDAIIAIHAVIESLRVACKNEGQRIIGTVSLIEPFFEVLFNRRIIR